MKKIITIAMAIIMMVIGLVVHENTTKAEAATIEDGKLRFSICDAVAEAKYYQERAELRSVLTLYDDTTVVIYKGKLEHLWRGRGIYADVTVSYLDAFAKHINAEVLI